MSYNHSNYDISINLTTLVHALIILVDAFVETRKRAIKFPRSIIETENKFYAGIFLKYEEKKVIIKIDKIKIYYENK